MNNREQPYLDAGFQKEVPAEQALDVDSFLKEVNDFLIEPKVSSSFKIMKPFSSGEKSFGSVLQNERTGPYVLEMARKIMINKSPGEQNSLIDLIAYGIVDSLPELEKQLAKDAPPEEEDDLAPATSRRLQNNILFLVSEAMVNLDKINSQKVDRWLLEHLDVLAQADPQFTTEDGRSDSVDEYTFKNIISRTESSELLRKSLQIIADKSILPVYEMMAGESINFSIDVRKEMAEILAEKIGLDKEIVEHWEQSKVMYKEGPDGTKLFEPSYINNLEAAKELERASPGSARALFKRFGVANFYRYKSKMLLRQLEMEETDVPYGVIAFPETDWNGAFAQNSHHLAKMAADLKVGGFETRIIEVSSQFELARRLAGFNKKYGSGQSGHKIDFLVIGGHGEPDSVSLGKNREVAPGVPPPMLGTMSDEEYETALGKWQQQNQRENQDRVRRKMKIDDLGEGVGQGIRRAADEWFEKGAPVVFISCSTGVEGGIAQKVSKELSFETIAPDKPTNVESINVVCDEKGKPVFRVEYLKNDRRAQTMRYVAGRRRLAGDKKKR